MKNYLAILIFCLTLLSVQSWAKEQPPANGKYPDIIREILREGDEERKIEKLSTFMGQIQTEFMKPTKDGEEKKIGSPFLIRMFDEEGLEINWATKNFNSSKVRGIFIGPGGRWIRFPAFFFKNPTAKLVNTAIAE